MIEVAKVISVNNNIAMIQTKLPDACSSKCGGCKGCAAAASTVVEIENTVNAQVGQEIKIERNAKLYMASAALVYGLPIVMLFIGILLAPVIGKAFNSDMSNDALSAIGGILSWISSYLLIKVVEKKSKLSKKATYSIVG